MRSRCLNGRFGFNAPLVFGVAIPPKSSNDEQNYDALHTIEVVNEGSNVRNQRRAAVMSAEGTALPARPLWIEGLAHGSYLATFLRSKRVIKVTSLVE